jgi:hypothetical protein
MDIALLGQILHYSSLLFGFLAALFGFLLLSALQGGRLAKAAKYEAIGLILLATNIFFMNGAFSAGMIDLLNPTIAWPISGIAMMVSFALLAYGKWQMLKVI